MYYYVGHNLFHDKLISQAHVTSLLHLYSPSEEGKKKNLSHISHSISQIPSAWDIISPLLLGSACVGAQACTMASPASGAMGWHCGSTTDSKASVWIEGDT